MSTNTKEIKSQKEIKMPHTYIIIAGVVIICWILTFMLPVGRFDTHKVTYTQADGTDKSREVLIEGSFRYKYNYDIDVLPDRVGKLIVTAVPDPEGVKLDKSGIIKLFEKEPIDWTQEDLDNVGLKEEVIYELFGEEVYDTSKKLKYQAGIWGTEDFYGFGILNYVYEGLVTGGRSDSAVAVVMLLLVVGGAFGIVLRTGSIDAGMFAFIDKVKGYEILVIPALTFLFSLGGAVFGMSEECIAFAMIIVPFLIAMGYDSLVGVGVSYVASQVGNAVSWMNPFGIGIAQGIAGVPVMSGAGFRIVIWLITTTLVAVYITVYGRKIKKDPKASIAYESDEYFRKNSEDIVVNRKFTIGDILVLLSFFAGMGWMIWGVVAEGYYMPEIASIFFVIGLVAGIIGVIFKLNNMKLNDIATSFQEGAASLTSAAIVVGMAKGIVLVLGGTSASEFTVLNTILYSAGEAIKGFSPIICALFMYLFQSIFNFFVTSGTGQAALTMPIMAPLADLVGISRQIATLCYQLGAGFMDAIVPTSASLMGVLGVARLDWGKYFKWQYKMQLFFFGLGCVFIVTAVLINFQ